MTEKDLKIKFLARVITDTAPEAQREAFFRDGSFPAVGEIEATLALPVDDARQRGLDWPARAHSMIGLDRMQNLIDCLDAVRLEGVPGDFIETGVWRGGACILACRYFDMHGMDRRVLVADSFQGLPPPEVEQDSGDTHHQNAYLRVPLGEVLANFRAYRCDMSRVIPLKGWFSDTLPGNPLVRSLAILRMDGDMYKSTMDVFDACYGKLSEGGFCIVDDYCLRGCREATDDFRRGLGMAEPFTQVDPCGIFWRKRSLSKCDR